jgi:hypothetical protein
VIAVPWMTISGSMLSNWWRKKNIEKEELLILNENKST